MVDLLSLTEGAVLTGLNISFDMGSLRPLPGLRAPNWHYSPFDIKSLAAGALGMPPPWSSNEMAIALGVGPADFARHGALAIYDAALARISGGREG